MKTIRYSPDLGCAQCPLQSGGGDPADNGVDEHCRGVDGWRNLRFEDITGPAPTWCPLRGLGSITITISSEGDNG